MIFQQIPKYLLCILTILSCQVISLAQQSKIDSLLYLIKNDKEDTNKVNHLNKLVYQYISFAPDTALAYAQQALNTSEQIDWKKGKSNSYVSIGYYYYTQADYPACLDYYLKALKISDELNDKFRIAASLHNIGNVYIAQADYPKALAHYLRALKIAEELGNKNLISSILSSIGLVYMDQADYPKALHYNFRALKTAEELGYKNIIVVTLGNIGNVYIMQSDYPKALEYYFKTLKICEELGDKRSAAINLGNIGNIYYAQADYPKALDYCFRTLKIAEELGNKNLIASTLGNIGSVYKEQTVYPKALNNYFKALQICEEIGDKRGSANNLGNIGALYTKTGKFKEAEGYLSRSLSLYDSIGGLDGTKDLELSLYELYDTTGRYKLALVHYKKYITARDSIANDEQKKKQMRTEVNYEFEKKESLAKAEQDKKDAIVAEEKQKQKIITYSVSGGLLLVLLLAIFIFRGYRQKQKANKALAGKNLVIEQQRKMAEEHNKDITDSINYAQRIQKALLASDNILNKNLGEYFVLFKPKDIVSGDFYWATEKDGRFYLAVCDSTGHGVPGAFMSLLNISFLNEAISEKGIKQPNEVLNHARQRLIENLSLEGAKDGMDGILVCFDKNKNEISYAAAHNAPVIVTNGVFEELYSDNMPVGLADRIDSFKHETLSKTPGTVLYLYTDGFADQFGGPKGKKFKYKQLNDLLLANSSKAMTEQKDVFEKTFEGWKGNLEQVDDVLVIGIQL